MTLWVMLNTVMPVGVNVKPFSDPKNAVKLQLICMSLDYFTSDTKTVSKV